MNSSDGQRPHKLVRFVRVGDAPLRPAWLGDATQAAVLVEPDAPVAPLVPPQVPSHPRPDLAPLLESLRPPPAVDHAEPPPPAPATPPEPEPPAESEPMAASAARERRPDTLIEDLVPRAEEEAVEAISRAVDAFAMERASYLARAEEEMVQLVKSICRRVLLKELSLAPSLVVDLVRAGLEALGAGDRVTVRLGPFFADVAEHIADELRSKGFACEVRIDPSVGRQGCRLETQLGRVDESVEARLAALLDGMEAAS